MFEEAFTHIISRYVHDSRAEYLKRNTCFTTFSQQDSIVLINHNMIIETQILLNMIIYYDHNY